MSGTYARATEKTAAGGVSGAVNEVQCPLCGGAHRVLWLEVSSVESDNLCCFRCPREAGGFVAIKVASGLTLSSDAEVIRLGHGPGEPCS